MRVGFVGWRGMVGSVLMARMAEEDDFAGLTPTFFSTSAVGAPGPDVGQGSAPLADANDLDALGRQDAIVTCQGGDWTAAIYPALRQRGWTGVWIDAASTLRGEAHARLVLDPVNGAALRDAWAQGVRTFVGANCTVSLLLMGLHGLLQTGEVAWISTMTYQAASGAGARQLRELAAQLRFLGDAAGPWLDDPAAAALDVDRAVAAALRDEAFPAAAFGAPLAASVIPWIDRAVPGGQTREEAKAMKEATRLLDREHDPLPIDGVCVRVGAMRCHAQAVTIRLKRQVPLDEIEARLASAHPWARLVPNTAADTLAALTPAAVAGTLTVPVGRLRPMVLGPEFLAAFTVGDQLLWGAAEPLRRMLRLIREL